MHSKKYLLITILIFLSPLLNGQSWIRINQLGYLENTIKTAVFVSKEKVQIKNFELIDVETNKSVYSSNKIISYNSYGPFEEIYRLDFSKFTRNGKYFIKCGKTLSPSFIISNDVYNGTADFLINYLRQQQCGYNPLLKDSCHTKDGFIIYNPDKDSTFINVVGGWHDASDYLQYVTTSANAVFQMLFAYQQNQTSFKDEFDESGNSKPNNIPDILDQAKWGLDWLLKMNPQKNVMFNQIADDRDHSGFRLPTEDSVNYGIDLQRPVYYCSGKPQGVFNNKNRTTGIASTAAKYSSAFALGSQIFKDFLPAFSETLKQKAIDSYKFGKENPGVCQTAPCKSPYFYEEENWVDDMELAAAQLNILTGNKNYLDEAIDFGKQEPVTPWMGADTARHYEWYPFINLGHYFLSKSSNEKVSKEFINYLKEGIEKIYQRGKSNPFLIGIPFIWCSNNLVAAALTQCRLYNELTSDTTYLSMEASLRDWLLGCNPWGTSMIIDLPMDGTAPKDPHSAFTALHDYKISGGLVDGPVYGTIFNTLKGLTLHSPDEFKEFQSSIVVYHDDYGDYSTNEPTMDGTASLTFYLSALQKEGENIKAQKNFQFNHGAIIRTDSTKKEIHLVFTGHEYADGLETVMNVLKKHKIKASFFFTGDFYRNPKFKDQIISLKGEGNYLGAHSDKHLLYASWANRDSTLISKEEFIKDIDANYNEMTKFGIEKKFAKYFLPPYEWYNEEINSWCEEADLILVNFTPGTSSNQDWTYPELDKQYISSDTILNNIINYENNNKSGLNGFILLTHPGTDPRRKDKFYNRLDELITLLESKGYKFALLSESIEE